MKHGIIYGGLIGLSFFLNAALNHYIDVAIVKFISNMLFVSSIILLVVLGLKAVKKDVYNNSVNYAQCLLNGFYIAGFAGISCALATFISLSTFNADYKEKNMAIVRENLIKNKTPEKDIPAILKAEEEKQDIRKASGMGFVVFSFGTIIIVVIASSFIRNKDTFNTTPPSPNADPQS